MIGKLSGRVDYVAEDHALIETGGVGYLVYCSSRTLSGLRPGEAAALYTELEVREDALTLYGFATLAEREWRRLLTSVQGVGSRLALAILGALGPEAVGRALALGDATAIRRAPGVGPKLAARIVNELKDKAPGVMALRSASARPIAPPSPSAVAEGPPPPAPSNGGGPEDGRAEAEADALSALVNLGYGDGEAAAAVAEASRATEAAKPEALIRAALVALARRG